MAPPARSNPAYKAHPLRTGPFHAIPLCVGVTYTMGGILTDAAAQASALCGEGRVRVMIKLCVATELGPRYRHAARPLPLAPPRRWEGNPCNMHLLELSAQWNFSTLDKPVRPMNLANALKQLVSAARG